MSFKSEKRQEIVAALVTLSLLPIIATIVWSILALIFGLSVSWLQVLGGIILIDLFKSLVLFRSR